MDGSMGGAKGGAKIGDAIGAAIDEIGGAIISAVFYEIGSVTIGKKSGVIR